MWCNDVGDICDPAAVYLSIDEDRYIAIGKVEDVLFVVFTERKENIRLISARLATEAERRLYDDQDIHY